MRCITCDLGSCGGVRVASGVGLDVGVGASVDVSVGVGTGGGGCSGWGCSDISEICSYGATRVCDSGRVRQRNIKLWFLCGGNEW